MGRILGKVGGKVVKKYNNVREDSGGVVRGGINKLWRGKIEVKGLSWGLGKDSGGRGKLFNGNGGLGERERCCKKGVVKSCVERIRRLEVEDGNIKIERDDGGEGRSVVEKNKVYGVREDIRKVKEVMIYNSNVRG